ncbi:hypothetical protein EEJ42_02145 [Streptomyces botrytidirepellens]|uniref:Integral membrane protein n=1 Tax=Streptomyces botrytidirepellens TaxID=2486417 RepID=A0A3M8X6I6_9ACTN|nr:hypothetical protein EEJ42_02145 [Streptomyces botrytidirepellens]
MRVLAYVAAGLVGLSTVVAGAASGPEAVGAALGSSLPVIGLFVCALRFASAGPWTRTIAIVCASSMILFGLGALGRGIPSGIVELVLGIVLVVLLSQAQVGKWFRRPQN